MNIISKLLLTLSLAFCLLSLAPLPAFADAKTAIQCGANAAAGENGCAAGKPATSVDSTIHRVVNLLSVLVGIAAVIVIILAGFRYITSGGDSTKVTNAKNALLYAVIGLVLAVSAQVLVRFVLDKTT